MKIFPRSFIIVIFAAFASLACAEDSTRFDELMKLEGKAFTEETAEAAGKHSDELSPAQLCALTERLYREFPGDENLDVRAMVFARACQRGDADSLARLVGIFAALPKDEPAERSQLIVPLADLWLLVKTAHWKQAPPILQFPKWKPSLPPGIKVLPQDLQEAWITWKRATDLVVPLWKIKPNRHTIAYQFESKQFWSLVDDLLAGHGKAWSTKLMRFQWVGWCGTGSEELGVPQSWALVMAFVAESRIPEAINASFWVEPAYYSYRYDEKYLGLYQFWQNSGFDWQQGIVGVLVNACAISPYPIGSGIDGAIDMGLLIDHGGEKSASLLLQLVRHASLEDRFSLLRVYAQFVTPGSSAVLPARRSNAEPISEKTQTGILQEISNQVVDNSRFEVSEELGQTLASLCRPETKDALYRLLQHPSEMIARRAAETLEKLGEKVTMPPKLGPVRYQVLVNGRPLAKEKIWWHLKTGSCSKEPEAETGDAGIVVINRDDFYDPTHSPAHVRLSSAQLKAPADLWFNVNVPTPGNDEAPIVVKLETKSFDLLLTSEASFSTANDLELKIGRVVDGGAVDPVGSLAISSPSSSLHFTALPPGVYHLEITAMEEVCWSGDIDTNKIDSITATLPKGYDVRFSLSLPKGWDANTVIVYLLKDRQFGRPHEASSGESGSRAFQRIPSGKYVLRVPSSRSLHDLDPKRFPARPIFEAVDFPFEITSDSPLEIDLGLLRIKPL